MKPIFFEATRDSLWQITDLYDFIWPTASAIWNLRWQVKGYLNELGAENVRDHQLLERFNSGSGLHGVNLRRACVEKTWDEQQEQFARFLLVRLCTVYEGWLEAMQATLGFNQDYVKKFQFPTQRDAHGVPNNGVRYAIAQAITNDSRMLKGAFYDALKKNPKNSLSKIENLLLCYRYFKECRNCLAHFGGKADQKALDANEAFNPIANPKDLGVDEVPIYFQLELNQPVKLSLRGVVGFGDIIIRLIITLDAELAKAQSAEPEFIRRCKEWSQSNGKGIKSLKKDDWQRSLQIRRIMEKIGFPKPDETSNIEQVLLSENVLVKNH